MIALWTMGVAHAGCAENPALPSGPVQSWLSEGMMGLAQPTCAVTSVGLAPRGSLVVDTPGFYGHLVATGTLDATFAPNPRTSVGLALEPLHYDSVISAVNVSWMGYGATTATLMQRIEDADGPVELAVVARGALPTPVGFTNNPTFGAEVGLAVATRSPSSTQRRPVEAHGQFGMLVNGGLRAPLDLRSGLPITAGVGWSAGRHFGLAADLQSLFGVWAAVDHLAVAPAVRVAGTQWGMELGGSVPVLGNDRTLASVRLGFRWSPRP